MRLIDADDALRKMESVMDMQDCYLPIHFKEMVIDDAPTVDAVEVVRCKDCKYFDYDMERCNGGEHPTMPDAFCSYAERRTDAE